MFKGLQVDLGQLAKSKNVNLLSGYDNGVAGYRHFGLSAHKPGIKLQIVCPNDVLLSDSYLSGLLERVMEKYEDRSQFDKDVFMAITVRNRHCFESYVRRCFTPIRSVMQHG
jgi:hypothetical protein